VRMKITVTYKYIWQFHQKITKSMELYKSHSVYKGPIIQKGTERLKYTISSHIDKELKTYYILFIIIIITLM